MRRDLSSPKRRAPGEITAELVRRQIAILRLVERHRARKGTIVLIVLHGTRRREKVLTGVDCLYPRRKLAPPRYGRLTVIPFHLLCLFLHCKIEYV